MILKTKDLRNFSSLASGIVNNNILPILAYWKLEDGKLTKTNTNAFVSHEINVSPNEKLLLDEKTLMAFIKESKSDEITATSDGKHVHLVDGKRKIKFPTEDINLFPTFPESEKKNHTTLEASTLKAIGVASKNVGSTGLNEKFDFVHLGHGLVVGTDRAKFYCKKVNSIPELVLDTISANIISQFEVVNYYEQGNHNFFEIGNTLYGFIKATTAVQDVRAFIPKEQPKDYLEMNVAEFVSFCDTAINSTPSKISTCKMEGNKLSFVDVDYDVDFDTNLDTTGKYEPTLSFLPRLFSGYFKSLGFETVRLAKAEMHTEALSVWSDEDVDFRGLLIGVATNKG